MADFEPVLLANIDKPDSHTLKVYEQGGGYQCAAKSRSTDGSQRTSLMLVK